MPPGAVFSGPLKGVGGGGGVADGVAPHALGGAKRRKAWREPGTEQDRAGIGGGPGAPQPKRYGGAGA